MRMTAYAVTMETRIEDLLTALSEPTRLRALHILWDGDEHCVCELMDRRDAQWVRYRRAPDLPAATVTIINAILAALPLLPAKQCQKKAA